MVNINSFLAKMTLSLSAFLILSMQAYAVTYTALASGNYSNAATWGSSTPTMTMPGDVIIIPSGVVVTLDADLNLNATLNLNSGVLVLNGYDLNFGSNSNLMINGSGVIHSDAGSNIAINCSSNLSSGLTFGFGNNVVNNLTINPVSAGTNISLGSDMIVTGTLTLASGILSLNGNDLAFAGNGDFSGTGMGVINGSPMSDIDIISNNSIAGALRFSALGRVLNNLTINFPDNNSVVGIASDLTINGALTLASGKLNAGASDITIALSGLLNGGSAQSYVITGNGGSLTMDVMPNTTNLYPVGTSTTYSPAVINGNPGSATGEVSVSVKNVVFSNGYNGSVVSANKPIVGATWYMSSDNTTGMDVNVQLMWDAGLEVNGFDRTGAYIAKYGNNGWDGVAPSGTILMSGLYSVGRNNITSLGPVTVAEQRSGLGILRLDDMAIDGADISLYPNPATDVINYTVPVAIVTIDIYDIAGHKVRSVNNIGNKISVADLAPGYYNILLRGENATYAKQFVKAN